ncbi:DUF7507 domain-containing protein [Amycolatopsis magusensis]|uniref:Repeat protein (TIGR01451 family) n=1 Tax=Amycolatopsis magusensis TaxID=882444 RepID=A0ABS4PLY4_9PSEU|nr:CARDB domain-containing protein [Amycolatopsis magusensis]MBP2179915.1 putative repeat protein (TIGR01451 family) [Amycolatopsis magusensis]
MRKAGLARMGMAIVLALGGPAVFAVTPASAADQPGIELTKEVVGGPFRTGDQVTFQLTVRNTGDVPLARVTVTDPRTPECSQSRAEPLEPGGVWGYGCFAAAPAQDFTNEATVTARPPAGRRAEASASAAVDVIHPKLDLQISGPKLARKGESAAFSVTVKNTGDSPLRDVNVADPNCGKKIGKLAAGATDTYECSVKAAESIDKTIRANGTDGTSRLVLASAEQQLQVINPGLSLTKKALGGPYRVGDSVVFRVEVANTGDEDLEDIKVADTLAPECARTMNSLLAGTSEGYQCAMTATEDAEVKTSASTLAADKKPLTSEATASVDVIHPSLKFEHTISPLKAHPGDEVTVTLTVTNTGDVPLTDVAVTDDREPSCGFTVESLDPEAVETRTCTFVADQDVTSTAAVSAVDPLGGKLNEEADSGVDVLGPGITAKLIGPEKPVNPGHKAALVVEVTNTGDAVLTDVAVEDPLTGCAATIGTLQPGEKHEVNCEFTLGEEDVVYFVKVTGFDALAQEVRSKDELMLRSAKPGLELTKDAGAEQAAAGATVTFTLTAKNTGNTVLAPVEVTDPTLAACDRSFERLGVGETRTWTCTTPAPKSGQLSNTANAKATPDTDRATVALTDSDTAVVQVGGGAANQSGGSGTPKQTAAKSLASTGVDALPTLVAGLVLLLAGAALVLVSRRGRNHVN